MTSSNDLKPQIAPYQDYMQDSVVRLMTTHEFELYTDCGLPSIGYIASMGGRIVGYVGCSPMHSKSCFIPILVVDSITRKMGVARALLNALHRHLDIAGYEYVYAFVEEDNDAALAAYRALDFPLNPGFQIAGKVEDLKRLL